MKRSGKYGHLIDEETRKRISESVRKRWQDKTYREKVENAHKHKLSKEWKNNISKGMTGIKCSDETKKKNECLSIK
jgi:predicted kinase